MGQVLADGAPLKPDKPTFAFLIEATSLKSN